MKPGKSAAKIWNYIRRGFLVLVNPAAFVTSLLFATAAAAGLFNPSTNEIPAIVGLFFPVLFVGMLFFSAILIMLRSKLIYFMLLVLLFSIPVSLRFIGLNTGGSGGNLKIFTYNVHGFRGIDKKINGAATHKAIAAFIQKQSPDIVCIQEFRSWSGQIEADVREYASSVGLPHSHFAGYWKKGGVQSDGYLILSRFPIVNRGSIPSLTKRQIGAFADISTGENKTIRVAAIHLISFSLGQQEIEAFGEAASFEMELIKKHGKSLFGKLRNSFNIRSSEIRDLTDFLDQCEIPLVVCGDFNDTPTSFTYSSMTKKGYVDCFRQAGFGLGATYAGNLPWLRIDYCFVSPLIKARKAEVHHLPYSDHFPLQITIENP